MNKVTVETINGKLCTVVWHIYEDGDIDALTWCSDGNSYAGIYNPSSDDFIVATALFALPRRPKPEDAKLLYRYLAEEILLIANRLEPINKKPESTHRIEYVLWGWHKANPPLAEYEITHAIMNGERVEIALEDSHDR